MNLTAKEQEVLGLRAVQKPIIVCIKDVEPEAVSFLWEPYLVRGKLNFLEGDPGLGKTWAALVISSIVSTGAPFPAVLDGIPRERREPANVIYLSAEDGIADTLRPRLDAAGADVNRVFTIPAYETIDPETLEGCECAITLEHVSILREAIGDLKPALVVVDPLQAFLGSRVDMYRANEVRPILTGISNLAEEFDVALLCIRHLGKSQQDRAVYRGLGSIDFAAAARSILLVGQDPDDPAKRAIIHTKSSLAAPGPSIGYELRDGQFLWTGLSDLTANKALRPEQGESDTGALDEAKDFLRDILADGPVTAKEIEKQRKGAGISEPTLRRAKTELSIKSIKQSDSWYWSRYILDDHLDHVPETLGTQGIEGTNQDDHMIILNQDRKGLQDKGLSQVDQDDQENSIRKNGVDDQDFDLLEGVI